MLLKKLSESDNMIQEKYITVTCFKNNIKEARSFFSRQLRNYQLISARSAACGTETFGFNAYECTECGHKLIHYNSCGNRHCPSCQVKSREEWISKMESFLLDIPYFHMVFTIPDSLNDICLNNKEVMYQILFKTSSQTLLKMAQPVYGQIGFTSILHTWGSNLWIHPHIHMIVLLKVVN